MTQKVINKTVTGLVAQKTPHLKRNCYKKFDVMPTIKLYVTLLEEVGTVSTKITWGERKLTRVSRVIFKVFELYLRNLTQ